MPKVTGIQGSELTVYVLSKWQICHLKSHLLPINKESSKKLLSGNSVAKVISGK